MRVFFSSEREVGFGPSYIECDGIILEMNKKGNVHASDLTLEKCIKNGFWEMKPITSQFNKFFSYAENRITEYYKSCDRDRLNFRHAISGATFTSRGQKSITKT